MTALGEASFTGGSGGFVVGGHRGAKLREIYITPIGGAAFMRTPKRCELGENLLDRSRAEPCCPGFRENTLAAFNAAARAEADFVEFDVQVTSDGVPVIFHDDYLVHGSLCAPRRSLVSELRLKEVQGIEHLFRWFKDAQTLAWLPCDFAWRCEHEDATLVPTLQDLFDTLSEEVGFNVEIKMATSAALPQTPLHELRRIVDPIVAVLAASATPRRAIAVSSFDPDVMTYFAAAARAELQHLPRLSAWYLTQGEGEVLRSDARRRSVPAAVEFALAAQLSGIVVHSGIAHARMLEVEAALAAGLQVMTYGLKNNDPAWVLQQRAMGFHGAIVDDVAVIVDSVAADAAGASPLSSADHFAAPRVLGELAAEATSR